MNQTAYIVFAHGSSVESANDAVRSVTEQAARRGSWTVYATAFLGGGRPSLQEAVRDLAGHGATRCVVIPYFLTLGLHLERDLPALIDEIRAAHPNLQIETTPPLDGHPALLDAVLDRAKESACRQG
jgi:sirohydrochlorin ferrochelatase